MIIAVLFSTISTFQVKFAYMQNEHLNGFDYMVVMAPIIAIMTLIQAWYLGVNILKIKKEARKWVLIRCIMGTTAMPMSFIALKYLPSSKSTFIRNLHPLMVTLIAFLLLKEKINKLDVIAVVGAFLGVVLMNISDTESSKINTTPEEVKLGIMFSLLTMVLSCGVTISIRLMNRHIHYMLGACYFAYSLLIGGGILLIIKPSLFHYEYYTFYDIAFLATGAISFYLGQTFNSLSYAYAEAAKVTPLNYSSGVILIIVDSLVFGYGFSATDFVGIIAVLIFLFVPILWQVRKSEKKD